MVLTISRVGDLFLGSFIPGFLLAGLFMLWVVFVAFTRPKEAPALPLEARTLGPITDPVGVQRFVAAFGLGIVLVPLAFTLQSGAGSRFAGASIYEELTAEGLIDRAFAGFASGRPRPVHMQVPIDVLEDRERLRQWAQKAVEVARAKKKGIVNSEQ